ncbi:MAG: hypothetical protein HY912_07865 [Desulfomonile tiedjei]|uniref:Uncharacterized protein n=1 Tax=Desulfomonile tiedjei TaxID=2358 RepID=A0A9D6UZP6_9BACT|nr:hypothetical protein [Desulfomonile tiedjei]
MEKYKYPDLHRRDDSSHKPDVYEREETRGREAGIESEKTIDIRAIVQEQLKEKERKASRRKWGGRGLIILGVIIILTSCPLYALSVIGPQTLISGLAMMAGGSALLAWRPKLKDTNEAIIVAAKYGNCLTATRLALELDISFEKADRIIQELVRSGIAEIDLEHKDPNNSIVYRVRGL